MAAIYRRFGLNQRQLEIIGRAAPKRDYYCQSARGNRLFELGLGEVACAFLAASSKRDQIAMTEIFESGGRSNFAQGWLHHRGLGWASDLLEPLDLEHTDRPQFQEELKNETAQDCP